MCHFYNPLFLSPKNIKAIDLYSIKKVFSKLKNRIKSFLVNVLSKMFVKIKCHLFNKLISIKGSLFSYIIAINFIEVTGEQVNSFTVNPIHFINDSE